MNCSMCGADLSEGPARSCCEDMLAMQVEPQPTIEEYCAPHSYYGDDGDIGRCYCGQVIYPKGGPSPIDPATVHGVPVDDGALECLSMVLDLHESDGEPSAFCVECSHSWPCATVRLIRAEATT